MVDDHDKLIHVLTSVLGIYIYIILFVTMMNPFKSPSLGLQVHFEKVFGVHLDGPNTC